MSADQPQLPKPKRWRLDVVHGPGPLNLIVTWTTPSAIWHLEAARRPRGRLWYPMTLCYQSTRQPTRMPSTRRRTVEIALISLLAVLLSGITLYRLAHSGQLTSLAVLSVILLFSAQVAAWRNWWRMRRHEKLLAPPSPQQERNQE